MTNNEYRKGGEAVLKAFMEWRKVTQDGRVVPFVAGWNAALAAERAIRNGRNKCIKKGSEE